MADYENPYQDDATFKPEELTIMFDVDIGIGHLYTLEIEREVYQRQVDFVNQFCPEPPQDKNPRVIPVDISADGVTLLTAYNDEMRKALPHLIEAMSIIAGAKVEYGLMTNDTWQDVTYDFNLNAYRLKTEEELWAEYLADPEDEGRIYV